MSFCRLAILLALSLAGNSPACAAWIEQGPGPTQNGQDEGLPNNPVAGAINAIAADPNNADVVYVGTVNGGVWKTTNATSVSPAWTPLTDRALPALSINSLATSPVNSNIVFAGTGSTSSDGFDGSAGFGVARSTDGGLSWSVLAGSTFAGRRINSIVPTTLGGGNVVLAATFFDNGGTYRSTDGGLSFSRVSNNGTSGLPDRGVSSLVPDPGNTSRFYAGVPFATGSEGVYRSMDGGVTWTPVNTGLTGLNTSQRILLSVHNNIALATNVVYAMIIGNDGKLSGVFRSTNQGGSWTSMAPLPSPEIFPGGQGIVHGAVLADPTDPNVVFIAGDRQNFPNANGCQNFSANMFRGNASLLPANPWQNVVCSGAHGTSPHADSRAMVFDVNGNILHACDGGIYKLAHPNDAGLRQWSSVNGDIRPSEIHSVAYDPLSHIVFGGTQDTGTTIQSAPGSFTWNEFLQGDGGVVAVDSDQTAHPGTSIRYTSFQFFGFFNRTTWDATNTVVSGPTAVGLNITSGLGTGSTLFQFDPNIEFYQPFVLNAINPSRMLIGTADIYESMNKGDSLANLTNLGFQGHLITALAYGSRLSGVNKPDVFYVGTDTKPPGVLHRVNVGDPIRTLSAYPGGDVLSVVMDPQNYQHVFVADGQSRVWASFDEGATWGELTRNLPSLSTDIRVLEVTPGTAVGNAMLIAGGLGGVFQLPQPMVANSQWAELGEGLPHGLVLDLHYDHTDNVLVAGILGRGAWTLTEFFPVLSVTPSSLDFGAVTVNTTRDLTFTVQNTGTGTLTGTAAASGAPFSVVGGSPFSLGAGVSQSVTVRFSPTSENTFSSNVNFISNGGNLSRSVTGVGIAVGQPDLVVSSLSNPPATVAPGGSFSVTDTTGNQGTATAGASTTRFRLSLDTTITSADPLLTGSRSVASLAAGTSSLGTTSVTVPTTIPPGTYFLGGCADGFNVVAESNEANNCRASTTTVQVGGLPDLVSTGIGHVPTTVQAGQSWSVRVLTTNNGPGSAGASRTDVYLSTDSTFTRSR